MSVLTNEVTFSIAGAAAVSSHVNLNGLALEGIIMPGSWTAAGITFQVSQTDSSYVDLYDAAGTEVALVAAASRAILLPHNLLRGWNWVRLRSGTAAVPVGQGFLRVLTGICRPYR